MKQGVKKNTKQTDDHGKCKSCGACKECGAHPAPTWPVYVPVYVQPVAPATVAPVYPRWDGPIWQVFPNTGMTVSETVTGLTINTNTYASASDAVKFTVS
jgi:hypothetical protein